MGITSVRTIEDARKFMEYLRDSVPKSESIINFKLVSESLKVLAKKDSKEDFRKFVEVYCEFYKARGFEERKYILSNLEWLCRLADHGMRIGCFNGKMNLDFPIRSIQQYFCQLYGACLSCGN